MDNGNRRGFLKISVVAAAAIAGQGSFFSLFMTGCGNSSSSGDGQVVRYPIDTTVVKTTSRMLSFAYPEASAPTPGTMPNPASPQQSPNGKTALMWNQLNNVSSYDDLGYGVWGFGAGLPIVSRTDIMSDPSGYLAKIDAGQITQRNKLINFFTITDIHLTDKEAPNQLIDLQQSNPGNAGQNTSIYSPVMSYTPQVFDAAIQTANALHKQNPFDFCISLGDASNSTMYNELRWYIDILDGEVITPSSGAHLGSDAIDYQKPFKAAGLDKSIPWYQTIGNHDQFYIGSFPVYADLNVLIGASYISNSVWSVPPSLLTPDPMRFPALFNNQNLVNISLTRDYGGLINGETIYGNIINSGSVENYATPPKVVADLNRRSLLKPEWIQEFFNSTTSPNGHGFGLVDPSMPEGFACYSFIPKFNVPLKIIVLDDNQNTNDGSVDIHGHGFLDPTRWAWLQKELADGQAANQLMIIAAHIPICVANIGSEFEWWLGGNKNNPTVLGDWSTTTQNAVDITTLVNTLWNTPNLLMWIAGHRHVNAVKAFKSPDATNAPEKGFWQVETSSLRDFPQQFRTFEVYVNSDYTVCIEAVNVDPAVAEGTPAAKSRKYAIATQQIIRGNLTGNNKNYLYQPGTGNPGLLLPTMDPSRPQDGNLDTSIQQVDLSPSVPYNASYNARLFKQLSPIMKARLQALYPAS